MTGRGGLDVWSGSGLHEVVRKVRVKLRVRVKGKGVCACACGMQKGKELTKDEVKVRERKEEGKCVREAEEGSQWWKEGRQATGRQGEREEAQSVLCQSSPSHVEDDQRRPGS